MKPIYCKHMLIWFGGVCRCLVCGGIAYGPAKPGEHIIAPQRTLQEEVEAFIESLDL